MTINQSGWRPETPLANGAGDQPTFTGNRALMLEEPLLFEIGSTDSTCFDFDEAPKVASRLNKLELGAIKLPGL